MGHSTRTDHVLRQGLHVAFLVVLAGVAYISLQTGDDNESSEVARYGVESIESDDGAPVDVEVTSPDSGTTPTVTLVPPIPTDPPRADPPAIGDLDLPCGQPGDGSDVGIDEGRIVIGVGNDRGGLYAAGSGQGVVEAVRALADHCNSIGGIAGRLIVVEEFDAAVVEVDERMAEACTTVFAMVGHTYLLDEEGESTRVGCGLPAFPASGAVVGDVENLTVAAVTSLPLPFPLHGDFGSFVASPLEASRIALVGPDTSSGSFLRILRGFTLLSSGMPFELTTEQTYTVDSEPDWPAIVSAARAADSGSVHLDGSCRMALIPFLTAAADVGWSPAVVVGSEAYDPACLVEVDGVSFSRVLLEMPFLPAEDGSAAGAVATTIEVFDEVGVDVTGDALRAASAFWLWATAAESCGSELDRACLVEEAVAVDEWTGGGLHAATDPGTNTMATCAVVMGVEDGTFVRRLPATPGEFDCEPLA